PILTPHVCRKLVGQAIDRLLVHLTDKVVAMENIGADESELISRRCRLFDGLDQLVTARPISSNDNGNAGDDDDDDELLAFYVPHRHKFRQLADILQMSMTEIMARYNSGLLSGFSKDQLQGLIRALFIDSEARQRNLAIIAGPRV
ncbi:ribosome biogenesis protein ytm1, partial [Spiromyces aspiralis]